MEESESVAEYFVRLLLLVDQIKACGESVIDLSIMEKILRTLPKKFDYIVVAIEESQDTGKLSVEKLQGSLEAHEFKLLSRNSEKVSEEQALKA